MTAAKQNIQDLRMPFRNRRKAAWNLTLSQCFVFAPVIIKKF